MTPVILGEISTHTSPDGQVSMLRPEKQKRLYSIKHPTRYGTNIFVLTILDTKNTKLSFKN